jgi:hypothetical protein
MRFLVIATPTAGAVPPEALPSLLDAEEAWLERFRPRLDVYGWFPGGGGFGVVRADDEETLNRAVAEHPFTPFSRLQVRPVVDGRMAAGQLREVLEHRRA